MTLIAESHVSDDVFERVRQQFDEKELVALTFRAVVINSWNRLVVPFRPVVSDYEPTASAAV